MTNFEKWKSKLTLKKATFYIEKSRNNCHECLAEQYCKTMPLDNKRTCKQAIAMWLESPFVLEKRKE
jgi:hypothetical protein